MPQIKLLLQIQITQTQAIVSLVEFVLLVQLLFAPATAPMIQCALEPPLVPNIVEPVQVLVRAHNALMAITCQMAAASPVIRPLPIAKSAERKCASAAALAVTSTLISELAPHATVTARLVLTPVANAPQPVISLARNVPTLFLIVLPVLPTHAPLVRVDIISSMASAQLALLVPMVFELPAQSQQTLSARALQAVLVTVRHAAM
jgi:hypothetical protein